MKHVIFGAVRGGRKKIGTYVFYFPFSGSTGYQLNVAQPCPRKRTTKTFIGITPCLLSSSRPPSFPFFSPFFLPLPVFGSLSPSVFFPGSLLLMLLPHLSLFDLFDPKRQKDGTHLPVMLNKYLGCCIRKSPIPPFSQGTRSYCKELRQSKLDLVPTN